jgi:hypothetical protein
MDSGHSYIAKAVPVNTEGYSSRQNQPVFASDSNFEGRYSGEFPAVPSAGKLALSPFGELSGGVNLSQILLSEMDLDGSNAKRLFLD